MKNLIPILIAMALLSGTPGRGEGLRAGAAQTVINPAPGTPLAGYYSLRPSKEVLDDLFCKALVIEEDGVKVALVACDLLSLPREVVVEARAAITQQTGIEPTQVMISATHQHTGPVVARESTRDKLDGGSSDLGQRYTRELPALIARAVADANARLTPSTARAAIGEEHAISFNRRFWMRDGTVGWNPPKLSPDIIKPAGPVDPAVGVLHFSSDDGRIRLATYVNFAMHPDTTGGQRISADFPGALARALAQVHGAEMVTIFTNGCCGNLNHRNIHWADRQSGPEEAARLGTALAGSVCRAWPELVAIGGGPLRAKTEIVKLPLPPVTEAEAEAARAVVARAAQEKFMAQVSAFKVLDVLGREGKPHEVEVQVIALGTDVAFVSLPGEIFVELGLAIKAASPFRHTFIAELANGSIGYIPNRSAYAEGNYEVVSARCAEGSGELLVEAAVRLLKELAAKEG